MSQFAVGIDLGGTNVKAALVEHGKGMVRTTQLPTEAEQGPDHILDRIASLVNQLRDAAPHDIGGIGIGSPGAINWERTTVSHPPNFPGWRVVNVKEALRDRLGSNLEVIVENDANAAALGSAHYGAAQPYDSFLMITLGTGVGGAIIYRNRIFRGASGAAGEIGHVTIDYEGPVDRWGIAGAIEAYLGQNFLSRHARFRLLTRNESAVHSMADADLIDITPRMLFEAAQAGDEAAKEIFAWAGHKLGCLLGSVLNLLDLHTVIVGGGVSGAGDLILEPAREAATRYAMPSLRGQIKVLRETRGNEVGMLGAAHLIFDPAAVGA